MIVEDKSKNSDEFKLQFISFHFSSQVMTFEGNKLIQKQGGDPASTIIREFKENEMITTLKVKDITAVRKYVVEH